MAGNWTHPAVARNVAPWFDGTPWGCVECGPVAQRWSAGITEVCGFKSRQVHQGFNGTPDRPGAICRRLREYRAMGIWRNGSVLGSNPSGVGSIPTVPATGMFVSLGNE